MVQWENEFASILPLDGAWQFRLGDQSGSIQTPGCWEAQGYTRRVEGPADFTRAVQVPADWYGQRVQLQFDAVSYHAEVSLNGHLVGTHTGAWSAFAFDVTGVIRPGEENEISLRVYKTGERFPLRESLVGFLPDVALMFGGIWQSARLLAFPGPALSHVQVLPDRSGRVSVKATIHHNSHAEIAITILDPQGRSVLQWRGFPTEKVLAVDLTVDNPMLWSPDQPNLYTVEIRLADNTVCTRRQLGFRELFHAGEQLLLNGVPLCLRGVLNWGWYPELLCPAPDEAAIRDEFRRVRELGYNMVKLCLYVPSPLYFDLADQEGMLLWLELPLWLPELSPRLREHGPVEYAAIMSQVHHHPSVVIYSLGCELEKHVDPGWVAKLDTIVRAWAQSVLFCDNSGSGEAYGYLGDLADFNDYHFYADLQFFEPLLNLFHRDWRRPRPLIFGEFCDADDYRDVNTLREAYGDQLPWWVVEQNPIHPLTKLAYSQQLERMQHLDVGMSAPELVHLSRQQSFVIRKTILEKSRARADLGGYVVTSIRDTPLSTSSMFDDQGHSKYAPEDFRRFNADMVLLVGRARSRRWTHGSDRPAPFEPYSFPAGERTALYTILAHAGNSLPGGILSWHVEMEDGTILAGGSQRVTGPFSGGRPQALGHIQFDIPDTRDALSLRLSLNLELPGHIISNNWPLWVFPAITSWPEGISILDPSGCLDRLDDLRASAQLVNYVNPDTRLLITSVLTDEVISYMHGGGSVLLLQHGNRPLPAADLPFWREGIKIIADHPVMNTFPNAGYVDLQFYGLAPDWAFEPDALTSTLPDVSAVRSLLRRLDARRFVLHDYLVDARVGSGRLIASTLRFQGGLGDQPSGLIDHLAGRWLLYKLLEM